MWKPILAGLLMLNATSAMANERYVNVGTDRVRLLGCFKEVIVPAKYSTKKILVKEARQAYVKRATGTIEHVEYPAVYREEKTLVEPSYKLMKQVACQ